METLISWNVNGIRAALQKGLPEFWNREQPDILCLQETKASPEQVDFTLPEGYEGFWASAEKKGYSGVATFTRKKPLSVHYLGDPAFDSEGRGVITRFEDYSLINAYFPNSQELGARLDYKLAFCRHIRELCDQMVSGGENVIVCGDFNIAHTAIDLKNPTTNTKNPGYLPEERAWMDEYIAGGYVDTFRQFTKEGGHYTWWSYRFKAREKDIGWRIDYHCVNKGFSDRVTESTIFKSVTGSDHCPVQIRID